MENNKFKEDITSKNFIPIFENPSIPGHPSYEVFMKIRERISKMSWEEVNKFLLGNETTDNT